MAEVYTLSECTYRCAAAYFVRECSLVGAALGKLFPSCSGYGVIYKEIHTASAYFCPSSPLPSTTIQFAGAEAHSSPSPSLYLLDNEFVHTLYA